MSIITLDRDEQEALTGRSSLIEKVDAAAKVLQNLQSENKALRETVALLKVENTELKRHVADLIHDHEETIKYCNENHGLHGGEV